MKHLLLALTALLLVACEEGGSGTPTITETTPEASVYGSWELIKTGTIINGANEVKSVEWAFMNKELTIKTDDTIELKLTGWYAHQSTDFTDPNDYCWVNMRLNMEKVGEEYYFADGGTHTVLEGHESPQFPKGADGIGSCSDGYGMRIEGSSYSSLTVSHSQEGDGSLTPKPYRQNTYNQWYLDNSNDDKLVWEMRHPAGYKLFYYFNRGSNL